MRYNPDLHHRHSIRLKTFDYTQNAGYFVTICTYQRELTFGRIESGEMFLSEVGRIVVECWQEIPEHFPFVELDLFVVMPNHFHGILFVVKDEFSSEDKSGGRPPDSPVLKGPEKGSLGAIIALFKQAVTRRVNQTRLERTYIWQRNYHEHIIRNDADLQRLQEYTLNNPLRWHEDRFYADS
jgi:putative transposase